MIWWRRRKTDDARDLRGIGSPQVAQVPQVTDAERMALPEIWAALEAIQRGRTLVELPVGQGGTFRLPAGAPLKITASFYRLSDSELVVTGLKVRMIPLA